MEISSHAMAHHPHLKLNTFKIKKDLQRRYYDNQVGLLQRSNRDDAAHQETRRLSFSVLGVLAAMLVTLEDMLKR